MNIIEVFQSFQTQEQAIEYLEKVRWNGEPVCPYCGSVNCGRHASPDRAMSRWQCRDCARAFSVTIGTLFHGTHVSLRDWFLVLALMLNAKKSASAYQIARDLGKRRATVWSMMQRIRTAMAADPAQEKLLYGIVEADETYVGGKPRRANNKDGSKPNKRGRGTKKVAVIGAVERGGRVVARVANPGDLSAKGIGRFLDRFVDKAGTILITDEYKGYDRVSGSMMHAIITHAESYADGHVHTNTIESFWALIKRAWYGSHHHYSRKYMPLYVAETCYKYNRRKAANAFDDSLRMFVGAVI
ncbi:IS1595 family transposase [Rhodomicrobium lacus]|uniref:IS1595 family transposase n=1 Tax=Rhodomicrobium lacus TaxID=2498452 RepID=UPI0026E2F5BE|nr:IS1595 family transposase [Rhodomicrobium lacus]WKW51349.1 IS1595 family transposase [Rhodomicrobium lacus]